jgi:S-formylglutathione hydrolase FrmB
LSDKIPLDPSLLRLRHNAEFGAHYVYSGQIAGRSRQFQSNAGSRTTVIGYDKTATAGLMQDFEEKSVVRKFQGPAGSVSRILVESQLLRGNLLGDPTTRAVDIYVPAGESGRGLPLLVDLVGITSSGLSHTNWTGFRENVPERLDRLIGELHMPPVVVAFPDCFTRLGGNQYVNSAAMGAWEDFLLHEMLPAVETHFGCGGEGRRGVFGKSSGGYGAITHALRHSDIWAAAACHSGDMAFELCYLPDMPAVLRSLASVENSIERWWTGFEAAKKSPDNSFKVMNILAMAASYDPDPTQFLGMRLPVTFDTCEIIAERWANWLLHDPVEATDTQVNNLRRLKALYIDCGTNDQFNLLYGARRFMQRLGASGIAHRYEEFPDNHTGVDYRMDESLPFLAQAISA